LVGSITPTVFTRPNQIVHEDSFDNLSLAYFHLSTLY